MKDEMVKCELTFWKAAGIHILGRVGRSRKLKDFLNEGKATGRVGRQPALPFSEIG